MQILSTDKLNEDIRNKLSQTYPDEQFVYCEDVEEAKQYLKQTDVIITYGEDLTENEIYMAPRLKWIMVISAGMDLMPFKAITEKGILVTNAKGIHKKPMAEYTFSMILQYARQADKIKEQEKHKIWSREVEMTEVNGKTIAILGTGAIGREIARLAKAFGMNTLGFSRSGRAVENIDKMFLREDLNKLLASADFVVSVLPHTDNTDKIMNINAFHAMKKEAVFINIGRGKTVDEGALIEALNRGEFAHAVLDVFDEEPLPGSHPFWGRDDVTVTPHISGISPGYLPRAMEIFSNNLEVFINGDGEYINKIDTTKGY
ncbi:D-2-hydroxyacid dehydrogenase [Alteribacillus sp. HJP-4]|uniref:D-2-hydroxyacid dehydrogenase n=1 Tax=Alteribacillus sp. HJP-4 TaxID=2775394 RepID=UPI0035CCF7E8